MGASLLALAKSIYYLFLWAQNWVLCCLLVWSMTLFKAGAPALNSWMI